VFFFFFFFQAEDGIRDYKVTGVQTCALPIYPGRSAACEPASATRIHFGSTVTIQVLEGAHVVRSRVVISYTSRPDTARRIPWSRSEERRVGKECRCRWGRER